MRTSILGFAIIFVLSSLAFTGNAPKGNSDNGRKYFRQNCKECHSKGGVGGEVTPLTNTVAQWKAYIEKGKHDHGTLAKMMTEQQLLDVKAFLMTHAADSEHPEICGR